MSSTTVRVSKETHQGLRQIALKEEKSIQTILEGFVAAYRRRMFLEEGNRAYETLRRDPKAWAEEIEERNAWENTLADGLKEDQ